jgi:hypothetical protein
MQFLNFQNSLIDRLYCTRWWWVSVRVECVCGDVWYRIYFVEKMFCGGDFYDKNPWKIREKRAKIRGIDWCNFYCPNSSHSEVLPENTFTSHQLGSTFPCCQQPICSEAVTTKTMEYHGRSEGGEGATSVYAMSLDSKSDTNRFFCFFHGLWSNISTPKNWSTMFYDALLPSHTPTYPHSHIVPLELERLGMSINLSLCLWGTKKNAFSANFNLSSLCACAVTVPHFSFRLGRSWS